MQTTENFLNCVVRLKERIQKIDNEKNNLAIKATTKEHSAFTIPFSNHNLIIKTAI